MPAARRLHPRGFSSWVAVVSSRGSVPRRPAKPPSAPGVAAALASKCSLSLPSGGLQCSPRVRLGAQVETVTSVGPEGRTPGGHGLLGAAAPFSSPAVKKG